MGKTTKRRAAKEPAETKAAAAPVETEPEEELSTADRMRNLGPRFVRMILIMAFLQYFQADIKYYLGI